MNRRLYLDNLKVILIAAIIAAHAVIGYSEFDAWSYSDVRETTLSPVVTGVLLVAAVPFGIVVIPLLFLVAGLLTPPSMERKGAGGYVRGRLLRLGVPFVVFALLLWPYLEYALFHVFGDVEVSYRTYLRQEGTLDTGVLWFVGTVLVFSLVYAGAAWLARGRVARPWPDEVRASHLVGLTVVAATATFLLRLLLPFESDNRFVDLNMWEWPTCAALFGLGVATARKGWLTAVPDRLRRQSRAVTLVGVGAAVAFLATVSVLGVDPDRLAGGWDWPALLFVAGESTVAVFGSVWLLDAAQRHLNRPLRWAGPVLARSAYGAFMLQGLTLTALAVALREVPSPAAVKALIVAAAGVASSFAFAWLLISRIPVVGRIL